jgi:hypothetical protein
MAVKIRSGVLAVTPPILVGGYQRLGEHTATTVYPEEGTYMFLRNVGNSPSRQYSVTTQKATMGMQ